METRELGAHSLPIGHMKRLGFLQGDQQRSSRVGIVAVLLELLENRALARELSLAFGDVPFRHRKMFQQLGSLHVPGRQQEAFRDRHGQ